MAIIRNLMGIGMPGPLGRVLLGDLEDFVGATGTTQATAYEIGYGVTRFTGVDSGTGGVLPAGTIGDEILVINAGSNALSIYPNSGSSINALSANAAFSVATASSTMFKRVRNTLWLAGDSSQEMFLQSGTGATARTVQAKLRDVVSAADFGASTSSSDNSAAIVAALAAAEVVALTAIYPTTQTIAIPNGRTLRGLDWNNSGLSYTGTGSAISNTNTINSSGYAQVAIQDMKITTASASNTGAAIELNGGGYAFYDVSRCRLTGTFKYGIIADGTIVTTIDNNIIENGTGVSSSVNIWIVNGDEHRTSQSTGFSNVITISRNQFNAATVNIADDGGNSHFLLNNNYNGASIPIRVCGVTNIVIDGGDCENAGVVTGNANILFTDTSYVGGASKGTCKGGRVHGVTLASDMVSGSSSNIVFTSAGNFHEAFDIRNNLHRSNLGRSAAIDVTKLRWSFCGFDHEITDSLTFFTGAHNNANGNILLPPPNSSDTKALTFGQTDQTISCQGALNAAAGNLQLTSQKLQSFAIQIVNTAGTLQHAIYNSFGNGTAAGYADKITGASATLANTPTVGAGTDFTSGVGIIQNTIVFNTASQTTANLFVAATVEYYDGNAVNPRAYTQFTSRDINGTTRNRMEIGLTNDMTGAAWMIDTTNLPAGKSIYLKVIAWLA